MEHNTNNFINHRVKAISHSNKETPIKHNLRTIESRYDKDNSIDNEFYDFVDYENQDFLYDDDSKSVNGSDSIGGSVNLEEDSQLGGIGTYANNLAKLKSHMLNNNTTLPNQKDRSINRSVAKMIRAAYREDRAIHKDLYRKNTSRDIEDGRGTWLDGVITFSPIILENFENGSVDKDEWEQACIASALESCSYLGANLKYVAFHYNETTPHISYQASNYDEQGKSITFKHNSKKELSILQDIAFKHLKDLGFDRGIPKEVTGANNQSLISFYAKKIGALNHQVTNLEFKIHSLGKIKDKSQDELNEMNKLLKEEESIKTSISSLEEKLIDLDENVAKKVGKKREIKKEVEILLNAFNKIEELGEDITTKSDLVNYQDFLKQAIPGIVKKFDKIINDNVLKDNEIDTLKGELGNARAKIGQLDLKIRDDILLKNVENEDKENKLKIKIQELELDLFCKEEEAKHDKKEISENTKKLRREQHFKNRKNSINKQRKSRYKQEKEKNRRLEKALKDNGIELDENDRER